MQRIAKHFEENEAGNQTGEPISRSVRQVTLDLETMSVHDDRSITPAANVTGWTAINGSHSHRELDSLDRLLLGETDFDQPQASQGMYGQEYYPELDEAKEEEEEDAKVEAGYETSDHEVDDPPVVFANGPPQPGWRQEKADQIAEFQRKWAQRPPSALTPEREDRSFIKHARRAGMTCPEIMSSGVLKTGRTDFSGVTYRIKQLRHQGKDINARTKLAAFHRLRRATKGPSTPIQRDTHRMVLAIQQGQTVQQIVDSGILTATKNTVAAVKHRWESMNWRGWNLPQPK